MRLFSLTKDGGAESRVWAYNVIESKRFGSIMFLRFEHGSREAFHSRAFNSVSWVLRGGGLVEEFHPDSPEYTEGTAGPGALCFRVHLPSWRPVLTFRDTYHKVASSGRTWVLTFRGPWAPTWRDQAVGEPERVLTHGRREVLPELVAA